MSLRTKELTTPEEMQQAAESLRIQRELDVQKARYFLNDYNSADAVILCSLHKARYENPYIVDDLRRESEQWLKANKYSRLHGQPWPEDNVLPNKLPSML